MRCGVNPFIERGENRFSTRGARWSGRSGRSLNRGGLRLMTGNVGSKLGEGGCSEIFEWEGPEKILKLAKANTNRHAMSREHQNSQMAWKAGLPAPHPYEFVEIDGRPGIVFERVRGETVMDRFVMDAVE